MSKTYNKKTYKGDVLYCELRDQIDIYFTNGRDPVYKTWYKKKSSKGRRLICEPDIELRKLQKGILKVFDDINIYERLSKSCLGFMPKKSIADNAMTHRRLMFGKEIEEHPFRDSDTRTVYGKSCSFYKNRLTAKEARAVKMDFKDAFNNISAKLIREGLKEITNFSEADIKRILKVSMRKGSLPQGAHTSPVLQNVAFNVFDNYLRAILVNKIYVKYGVKFCYTRFADDIVLSIGKVGVIHKMIPIIESVAKMFGLKINHKKTLIMSAKNGIFITGINVINSSTHLCVSRNYRNQVRSLIHKTSLLEKNSIEYEKSIQRIRGKILHVLSVDKSHGIKLWRYATTRGVLTGKEKIANTQLNKETLQCNDLVIHERLKEYTKKKYEHDENSKTGNELYSLY